MVGCGTNLRRRRRRLRPHRHRHDPGVARCCGARLAVTRRSATLERRRNHHRGSSRYSARGFDRRKRRAALAGRPVTLDSARLPPVVAVVSPKGGSGKTAVASNLALAFAQRTPSVLVDLDMYSGDLEWAFGVQPAYRIHDVARRLREDGSSELAGMLTARGANLSLLCSPDSHIAADGVLPTDMSTI
ncbi:MAG: tyrosine-protein kinase family protein, partial [Actinobacteria bacterium]|nr:tyrosine-protein kinase family protein [Actinomycetota bacterium]